MAAAVMGIPADALRDQFEQGRSIAEVVAGGSTDLDDVIHAIIQDLVAKLHQAVGHGSLSEQDAREIEMITPHWATRLVHGHRGDFRPAGRP